MRAAIEGYCAVYAAEKAETEEGKILCQKLEEYLQYEEKLCNEGGDAEEFIKNDIDFHFAIIDFCGNKRMKEAIVNLRNQINRIGIKSFYKKNRMKDTTEEHRKIADAIKNGNASEAEKSVKTHLRSCEEILKI